MAQLLERMHVLPEGWQKKLIPQLHKELLALNPDYSVADVKLKFGGLRVYLYNETPEMWNVIGLAEIRSLTTCMKCGHSGYRTTTLVGGPMISCREHDPIREVK